jgi:ZIP family zinc transporter
MLAIGLAALTVGATTLGGFTAFRAKDRFHLVLGLSAGLLLGLVAFDLFPEFSKNSTVVGNKIPAVYLAFVIGFLLLHFSEQFAGSHEPAESDFDHDHSHYGNIAGSLGALAMAIHIFLDGVALGVAFKVSHKLGYAVFLALLVHAFSDGLNTVAMLVKTNKWRKNALQLLEVDAMARIGGASIGTYVAFSENWISIYLALFAGFLIYIATSHILPEAHSRHPSRVTMAATLVGVVAMFIVVSYI